MTRKKTLVTWGEHDVRARNGEEGKGDDIVKRVRNHVGALDLKTNGNEVGEFARSQSVIVQDGG
jgi:hypothetical protein